MSIDHYGDEHPLDTLAILKAEGSEAEAEVEDGEPQPVESSK